MADVIAPAAVREESIPRPEDAAVEVTAPASLPRALMLLWGTLVVGLVLYLGFGSVRVVAGNWIGRRMAIREIWSQFLGYLVDQGASPGIVVAVVIAAALSLVGCACVTWLAFALKDPPTGSPPDDAA